MSLQNLTWQQALVFIACMAAPVLAYRFLGSAEAVAATTGVGMIVNFMLGRPATPTKDGAP